MLDRPCLFLGQFVSYTRDKLKGSVTLAAAVGFGGGVLASMTGVLQGNAISTFIVATESSTIQLRDADISWNMGLTGTGVLMVGASTLHVVNSTLSGNIAFACGGAIAAWPGTNVKVVNSRFTNNVAAGGGGLFLFGNYTIHRSY